MKITRDNDAANTSTNDQLQEMLVNNNNAGNDDHGTGDYCNGKEISM